MGFPHYAITMCNDFIFIYYHLHPSTSLHIFLFYSILSSIVQLYKEHSIIYSITVQIPADAHLIPTRNKGLLHYLPHRNLDVCNGSRLSHRAYRVFRASLGQNERAHMEKQRSVSLSITYGVMKGTYTLLNPSAPLIWNFICFCVDHSGYRGNLQRS